MQRSIDRSTSLRAFGCRDNRELDIPRSIACDIETWNIRGLVLVRLDRAAVRELTPKTCGQIGALSLAADEEQRLTHQHGIV